jgi:hypothetical protein
MRYIERPGEVATRPPLAHLRTNMRCFWMRTDRDRLRALCDISFDQPSRGAVPVTPVADGVALVWADIPEIRSTHPLDADKGYASEIDVSLWIPVRIGDRPRIAWFIPWLFVDSDWALILGREMYGFPKTLGRFSAPAPGTVGAYTVDAMALPRYGADVKAASMRVVEVRPTGRRRSRVRDVANLASFAGLIDPTQWLAGARTWQKGERPATEMVFLRQFRDVADADEAVLQEIVLAPAEVLAIHGGGMMSESYEVAFPRSASLPIADALGLRADGHPVEAAFHVTVDFAVAAGRSLWRAKPTGPVERPAPAALRGVPALAGFDDAELAVIAHMMRITRAAPGQALVEEGDANSHDGMYVLLEGRVRVRRTTPAFERVLLPGELFGLVALVDRGPRAATCRAEGACVVASLDRSAFEGLRRSANHAIAGKLQWLVATQLARDFQALAARLREVMAE